MIIGYLTGNIPGMGTFRFVGGTKPDLSRKPFMMMDYSTVGTSKYFYIDNPTNTPS